MEIKEVAEWFLIAKEDEIGANDLNKESTHNLSYYHCSQAIEKYLKGYLSANNVNINYNHDISVTLNKCIKLDKSFEVLFTECNEMTNIIKKLRYPGRIIATKDDVRDALDLINKVKKMKPIQSLFNILIENHGENWEDILFKKLQM